MQCNSNFQTIKSKYEEFNSFLVCWESQLNGSYCEICSLQERASVYSSHPPIIMHCFNATNAQELRLWNRAVSSYLLGKYLISSEAYSFKLSMGANKFEHMDCFIIWWRYLTPKWKFASNLIPILSLMSCSKIPLIPKRCLFMEQMCISEN